MVCVGQACNFKCRDCSNFCPISPKEYLRYDVQSIEDALTVLFRHVERIDLLQIQGGEPFLYTDLGRLVSFLEQHRDKVKSIDIATNGSVLPSDALMSVLRGSGTRIRISDYNVCPDKVRQLQEKCEQFQVNHRIYPFAGNNSQWYYQGGPGFQAPADGKALWQRYLTCAFCNCLTLERGELSYCSRATNSYHIQSFPRKAGDFLKVEDAPGFREALRRHVLLRHPMTACQYCRGTEACEMGPAAVQMENREEMWAR